MKNTYISAIILSIICNIFIIFPSIAKEQTTEPAVIFKREEVIIHTTNGDKKYNTEIAITDEQQKIGLMYRDKLPANEAMLFLFSHDQKINMWMKNTLIPLDMLFIDNSGKIVHIAPNATPNSLTVINAGDTPVLAVLELKGGIAKEHNIKIGDQVDYRTFKK